MSPEDAAEERMRELMFAIEDDELVAFSPSMQRYLEEHRRREMLPREVCPNCQFEYHAEQPPHVCRQFER